MKLAVLSKGSSLWVCLIICFNLTVNDLFAQQRYFAVTLINENDGPNLQTIRDAKEVGCNAVALTIQWGAIEGKISRIKREENGAGYNLWKQYDDQINLAISLGMKVAINVAVSSGDDASHSTSDKVGIDTGDGWKKEERMVVRGYDGVEAVLQKYGGEIRPGVGLQFVMTSLAAQSTRNRIVDFTRQVIERYKYVQDAGNLLYVNLIFSRQGEGEFEIGTNKYHFEQPLNLENGLTDYAGPMSAAYRNWLKDKYGLITYLNSAWGSSYGSFDDVSPKSPSNNTYNQPDGRDWFQFRTQVLKEVNNLFKNTVKGIDSNIKVITHHGSSFDRLSRSRGTLHFNEIGADLDGIKINDDVHYDHRFAIDLLRSNLPGRLYVNEAAYVSGMDPIIELTKESYTHGAQIITLFYLENLMQSASAVTQLKNLTKDWVTGKQVITPVANNSDSFNLSNQIDVDGCATNRDSYSDDCAAYKNWRNAYNSANKPVNIFLNNDIATPGCQYKDLKISSNGDQASTVVPDNSFYHLTGDNCRVIATVKGTGLSNGSSPLTASAVVDNEINYYDGQPCLKRHVKITPGNSNPSGVSVTLYVSQEDFNAFNDVSSVKLPKNSQDSDNTKGKLRILQWNGSTTTGPPNATIVPSSVQWDSALSLWRVSFTTNTVSSFFVSADKAGPLPVKLVRFSGKKSENAVALDWETSEETNSAYFNIEHSQSGKEWKSVGKLASSQESAVLRAYSFKHQNPAAGENLYRLKMVDQDSTFAYSKIVQVRFDMDNELAVYPNPSGGGQIQLQYAGAVPLISFSDINGRTIQVATEKADEGRLSVTARSKLNPGLYILTADYGTKQVRYKVLVVN